MEILNRIFTTMLFLRFPYFGTPLSFLVWSSDKGGQTSAKYDLLVHLCSIAPGNKLFHLFTQDSFLGELYGLCNHHCDDGNSRKMKESMTLIIQVDMRWKIAICIRVGV